MALATGALIPAPVRAQTQRGGHSTYGTLPLNRSLTIGQALLAARRGITGYLRGELDAENLSPASYQASLPAIDTLEQWLTDENIHRLVPSARDGIINTIIGEEWEILVDAFFTEKMFGTAGVRGVAHRNGDDVLRAFEEGLEIPRLRGPNWINELTVARVAQGIIDRMKAKGETRILIGCDPRVKNMQLAEMLARVAIGNGMQVFLADKESPFPLLMHAITQQKVRFAGELPQDFSFTTHDGETISDQKTLNIEGSVGMYISASHNGRKDNGFKYFQGDSSQAGPDERRKTVARINTLGWGDIKTVESLDEANPGQLIFVGGDMAVEGKNCHGAPLLNIEDQHRGGMLDHVINIELLRDMAPRLVQGYSAFNGAGGQLYTNVTQNIGVPSSGFLSVDSLFTPDGRFMPFEDKMPDPGDTFGAGIFFQEFMKQYGQQGLQSINAGMFAHDPDADRKSLMLPLFGTNKEAFRGADWVLIKANLLWSVLSYYRFSQMQELNGGNIPNRKKRYVMLSHATTDMVALVAKYFGIKVLGLMEHEQTGLKMNVPEADSRFTVGMNYAAAAWRVFSGQQGLHNDWTAEESNGLGIFGSAPLQGQRLGNKGWILDKDGFLASLLTLELFAYLNDRGIHFLDYVAEMSRNIGTYIGSSMTPLPEKPWTGPTGTEMKQLLLSWAADADQRFKAGETVKIGDRTVTGVTAFRTGKYPIGTMIDPPDQGVKFTFADKSWSNVRPSGTANQLRGYEDLRNPEVAKATTNEEAIRLIAETERRAVELNTAKLIQVQEEQGIAADRIIRP
ncbi:MAG: hypothetical protein HQ564_00930 [Candidatus Saganbacteria bacterium]|nr:hypothetical protein [Candidatus Saganbacteria bacterium]